MTLLLVRHGEIPSNVNKVYAGRRPERLTVTGVAQARKAAEGLKNYTVSAIYSSPILRAIETAEIIKETIGMDYLIDESFREMELGPWEGMAEEDVAASYPQEWQLWNTRPAELILPERETLEELLRRVLRGIQNIPQKMRGKTVVIVSHVAIIRVLLLWHQGKSLNLYKTISVPNAEIFEIELK